MRLKLLARRAAFLSLFQIACVAASVNQSADRSEKPACLIPRAVVAPAPCHAHCIGKFPGFDRRATKYACTFAFAASPRPGTIGFHLGRRPDTASLKVN